MSMESPSPDADMYVGGVDDFAEASSSDEQFELLRRRLHGLTGEARFAQEEDTRLETTRMRLSNVLKRFKNLGDRITRDSDKLIYQRLQKEFDIARTTQTEEILLKGDEWNEGLLATIRDRVHMEADRKAMSSHTSMPSDPHTNARITYRVGNKVICCLEGARIGIQYETAFAGEPCEMYHCVLESKSFLEKMSVIEHTLPFFLPIREAEANFLSSNAMEFIEYIGALVQSFVDRREQVRVVKDLYGNQIKDLFHSLAYNFLEFVLDDFECKVTVSVRYGDLVSVLPQRVKVLAWPGQPSKNRKRSRTLVAQSVPYRVSYAEEALKTLSLPEAYAEIVLNLPRALRKLY